MKSVTTLVPGLVLVLCAALLGCSETPDSAPADNNGNAASSETSPGDATGEDQPEASDAEMMAVHLELPGMT